MTIALGISLKSGHIGLIAALFTMDMEATDEWIKKLLYIYSIEYYSTIKRNTFDSVLIRWVELEPIIPSGVSQKEKNKMS